MPNGHSHDIKVLAFSQIFMPRCPIVGAKKLFTFQLAPLE
jgi:hypothetical protein